MRSVFLKDDHDPFAGGGGRWGPKATAALAGIAEADDREVAEKDLAGLDV